MLASPRAQGGPALTLDRLSSIRRKLTRPGTPSRRTARTTRPAHRPRVGTRHAPAVRAAAGPAVQAAAARLSLSCVRGGRGRGRGEAPGPPSPGPLEPPSRGPVTPRRHPPLYWPCHTIGVTIFFVGIGE